MNNNCLCNLFDNNCTWIIVIALIILLFAGNNGCGTTYQGNGCGCGNYYAHKIRLPARVALFLYYTPRPSGITA